MTSSAREIGTQASVGLSRHLVWRVLPAASITYWAGRLLAAAMTAAVVPASPAVDPLREAGAAIIVGGVVTWLAPLATGSRGSRAFDLGALLFASVAAVMLEGAAFAPALSPLAQLPAALAFQLVVCGATATVAVVLTDRPAPRVRRSVPQVRLVQRVAFCTLLYVLAYFVTGAINYALITGPYYAAHDGGLRTPEPVIVLLVAAAEGVALTLGTMPLARALTGSRRTGALACGVALWLLGGMVPLLQVANLPDVVRAASAVEIFFQKVPLGIAVVGLLSSRPAPAAQLPWTAGSAAP